MKKVKKNIKNHVYDIELIRKLLKKRKGGEINKTEIAKEYAKLKKIVFNHNIVRSVQRNTLVHALEFSQEIPTKTEDYKKATKNVFKSKGNISIITWAQSYTSILKPLLEGVETLAKEIGANILVIPGTYWHPTSTSKEKDVWPKEIHKYLYASDVPVHSFMRIIADANILPTARVPLNGLQSVTGFESSIIGHPRHHIKVVANHKHSRRKYMATTGSLTVPNYKKSRVGKEASIHHKMGFVIVETISKDNFVFRHVVADKNGNFQDLIYKWEDGVLSKDGEALAMVFGDTHLTTEDAQMLKDSRGVFEKLKTKASFWHDLFNGTSINHHEAKDHVSQVIKERKGDNSLQRELDYTVAFIEEWKDTNMFVIPSNHNDWLDRWVRWNQGVKDIKNATLFNKFQAILFEEQAPKGLYAYYIDQHFEGQGVVTLSRDISHMVAGIEINNHGDLGANGAKGTPITFKNLSTKVISGDKHTMYTYDNAYGVGISCHMDQGYNLGMTSWNQSNIVILENGTVQHLMYEGKKFTNYF